MELVIDGIGSRLQGVGRAPDGRAVFVPFALPGERVEAEVTKDGGKFFEARLVKVIEASPERIQPACPHFGRCGGCAALHMTYGRELALKRQVVEQALQRIGGLKCSVAQTIASENPWRYRNKAEYAVFGGQIGMTEGGAHTFMPIADCLLQSELSVRAAFVAREWLTARAVRASGFVTRVNAEGALMATLVTNSRDARELFSRLADQAGCVSLSVLRPKARPAHALDGDIVEIYGAHTISERLLGLTYDISAKSFFQVNIPQAEKLFGAALAACDFDGSETVVDAYCGAGAITLPLAGRVKRAIGVELSGAAIGDARANAARNGVANAEFIEGDAPREIRALLKRGLRPDAVTLDPPRKGADASLIAALRAAAPRKIAYISCNPATMARDVGLLCADGLYFISAVQPVDMFSRTEHVETVALLSRDK